MEDGRPLERVAIWHLASLRCRRWTSEHVGGRRAVDGILSRRISVVLEAEVNEGVARCAHRSTPVGGEWGARDLGDLGGHERFGGFRRGLRDDQEARGLRGEVALADGVDAAGLVAWDRLVERSEERRVAGARGRVFLVNVDGDIHPDALRLRGRRSCGADVAKGIRGAGNTSYNATASEGRGDGEWK